MSFQLRAQVRGEEAKEESRSLFKEFEAKKKSGTEMGYLAVIAKKRNYPPSIVARLVLREWYRKYEKRTLDRNEIIDLVKDYWKIPDPGLGLEVYKADISDTACGTICDAIRHAMGVQYEELTKKALDDLRVPERLSVSCIIGGMKIILNMIHTFLSCLRLRILDVKLDTWMKLP